MARKDELTRREAADLAGVHMNTVRLWEKLGRVSARKDGGTVVIPRSDVEAMMARRAEGADPAVQVAVLKAENVLLRERLEHVQAERDRLLDVVISRLGDETSR